MSTLQLIKIYTNNLKELHKKICENTQISWKAVFVDMCRVGFKLNYISSLFLFLINHVFASSKLGYIDLNNIQNLGE